MAKITKPKQTVPNPQPESITPEAPEAPEAPKTKTKAKAKAKIFPNKTKIWRGLTLGFCEGTQSWYPVKSFTKDPRYSDEYLKTKGK